MVQAAQTTFGSVLSVSRQLRVPLYQRRYAWKTPDWDVLWADVAQVAQDRQGGAQDTHFLGSLVLSEVPGRDGRVEPVVVDGQQRLTTLSLLLAAVRDHGRLAPALLRRVDACLFQDRTAAHPHDRVRLLPTQQDRDGFVRVVCAEALDPGAAVTKAYQRFAQHVLALQRDEDESATGITAADVAQTVLDGLECVVISADEQDNVHRIFESLNNRGAALTQADLLRNYVFMRLDEDDQHFYEFTWKPLEELFDADDLTQLFWLDLVRERPVITQRQTYVEQQKRLRGLAKPELKAHIERVVEQGQLFRLVLEPEREKSAKLRQRLVRQRDWGSTTSTPLLMYLLRRRAEGRSTVHEVTKAVHHLESYYVRRMVMGRATMNMNRVLLAAPQWLDDVGDVPVDKAFREYLSEPGKHWASDEELRDQVAAKAFYNHGRAHQKTLVLKWVEEGLAGLEMTLSDELTIEHVMPQSLTDEWKSELRRALPKGTSVQHVHEELKHTLGNLTLTARNSELGARSFADKKVLLKRYGTGLELTKEITKLHSWTPAAIRARSAKMVERIITSWPGPVRG